MPPWVACARGSAAVSAGDLGLLDVDPAIRRELLERLEEFEQQHFADVQRDGPGWVPRISWKDYAFAIAVNTVVVIWLIVALVTA